MDDTARDSDAAKADAKAILRLERQLRQLGRVARNSEQISRQNQAAYRRTVADLEASTVDLTEATARAESAVAAKDTFLATMSHEIRTPMNGVIGCMELIDRAGMSAEQLEVLATMQSSANALLLLLNDVLDFTKLEGGYTTLELMPYRLDNVLEEVAFLHAPAAAARGVEVRAEWDDSLTSPILGDPHRIRQVIHNLVSNAVKFTAKGAVVLSASTAKDGELLRIAVKDTGVGIPTDAMASIFMPFSQADASTTRRFGGTGLGLAICKSLVDAMGGDLCVESQLGSGSTFSFETQLQLASSTPEDKAAPPEVEVCSIAETKGLRVLLVDDTPVNLLVAAKMLGRLGCSVQTASGGSEAVKLSDQEEWDIIFMDCSMPVVDGYEATRRIRAAEGSDHRVPIVALTAFAMQGDKELSLQAGMDFHLTKPLKMDALREILALYAPARRSSG